MKKWLVLAVLVMGFIGAISSGFACASWFYEPKMR